MRRIVATAAVAAVGIVVVAVAGGATPAAGAQGKVVVFSTETAPLTLYDDPSGCQKLPVAAHVLDNMTDSPVTIYGDPLCLTPGSTIAPGYGSHVAAGSGSFSA